MTEFQRSIEKADRNGEYEWREVFAMVLLGYARVSTNQQDTAAQVAALKFTACEKISRENRGLLTVSKCSSTPRPNRH